MGDAHALPAAAGETLRLSQADVALNGWAVESRIYAEDPTRNFLPSTGRLVTYRAPQESTSDEGVTVRNDTGVEEGGEISIYYDPMIAKLVTHAPTREMAIEAQAQALDAFAIDGIRHNIPFLSALMQHPRWRSGHLSTGFIAEEFPDGFHAPEPYGEVAKRIAAVAAAIDHRLGRRQARISGRMRPHGPAGLDRDRVVMVGGERYEVLVEDIEGGIAVVIAGESWPVESAWHPGEPVWRGSVGGAPIAAQVRPILNGFWLAYAGASAEVRVYSRRTADLAALMPEKIEADTGKQLLCPMPGLVKAINVKPGQEVKAGEALCIVEAMKMENVLRAERDAVVATINAKEGDSLAVDAVIMEFA
jgi:propionyl-CoA carboxylase alpha chain